MKKSLLFLSFALFFLQAKSQCTRTATFQNGDYAVSGSAELEYLINGTKTLLFSGFSTTSGPDVDVYLSNSNNSISGGVFINDLSYLTTSQYTIPSNININDYQYVVLWCTTYSAWWGYGSLGVTTGADCSTLSINDYTLDEVTIYPNPARDIVHLKGLTDIETKIHIFDIFGKLVYSQNKNNKDIDVSQLNAGIYLLSISNQGRRTTQKLVIQ